MIVDLLAALAIPLFMVALAAVVMGRAARDVRGARRRGDRHAAPRRQPRGRHRRLLAVTR